MMFLSPPSQRGPLLPPTAHRRACEAAWACSSRAPWLGRGFQAESSRLFFFSLFDEEERSEKKSSHQVKK